MVNNLALSHLEFNMIWVFLCWTILTHNNPYEMRLKPFCETLWWPHTELAIVCESLQMASSQMICDYFK